MALSKLELEMSMNIAKLQSDVQKATSVVNKMATEIKQVILGISFVSLANQFKDFVDRTIDSADKLNDLRTRTGLTGQELIVLQGAAVRGGGSLEDLSGVASRLSKRLGAAELGTGEAAKAFDAMGISLTDSNGKLKTIGLILKETGEKFKTYSDGANKAVLATAALGKGGDAMIPVLEGIEETEKAFRRLGITIDEDFITRSDKFKDTIEDLKSVNDVFARHLVSVMLPHMQEFLDKWVEMASDKSRMEQKVNTIIDVLKGLAVVVGTVAAAVIGLGRAFGALGAAASLMAQGEFSQALQAIKARFQDAKSEAEDWGRTVRGIMQNGGRNEFDTPINRQAMKDWRDYEQALKDAAKTDAPNVNEKKIIEEAQKTLREISNAVNKEYLDIIKSGVNGARSILEAEYQSGLVTERDYWANKLQLQRTGYQKELAFLQSIAAEKQKELEKAMREHPATKVSNGSFISSKEELDAFKALQEALMKIQKLEADYASASKVSNIERSKSAEQYLDKLNAIKARLLELQGDTVGSERLRRAPDLRDSNRTFANDPAALAMIADAENLADISAQLTNLQTKSGQVSDALRLKEEAIERSARAGAITQIESMQQIGAARQKAVADLEELTKAHEEASAKGSEDMKLRSQRMRSELESLKESADVMGNKIKSIFEDSFSNEFSKFITGTQNMSQAFKNFALSVIGEIAKIQAKSLAASVFGDKGGLGSIFSGGGGSGGIFSGIGDFIGGLFKAEGGPVSAGRSYIVGEQGPELFTPGANGMITPNSALGGGGVTIVQNISVDARSDQASIMAAMRAASRQAVRSVNESLNRGGTFARATGVA
jgi:hypothetical protein